MKNEKLTTLLFALWKYLSPKRHRQYSLLIILIILASFAEVVSIGAVLPFLTVLLAPDEIFKLEWIKPVLKLFAFSTPDQLLLPLTISFALAAFFAGAIRLFLLWVSTRLSFSTGADLSIDIYRKTLYQPYSTHVSRNSSEVVSGILLKSKVMISGVIMPIVNSISSGFILISIMLFLLNLSPILLGSIFALFSSIYLIISLSIKKKLSQNSKIFAEENNAVLKTLQEGLGGIRDLIIDSTQEVYCDIFKGIDSKLRKASAENTFLGGSPRFLVESLSIIIFAFFVYRLTLNFGGLAASIPLLGSIALGAQRLLPALQLGFQSWAIIKSNQGMLQDVISLLNQSMPSYYLLPKPKPMEFKDRLSINKISFRYHVDGPWILKDINFSIPKGFRVGFIGTTGSGKSTLIDIIMGLLVPTEGAFLIDNQMVNDETMRAWQANLAHVPQSIFLSDNTIAENIAFGVPIEKIDFEKVKIAAKKAQISTHIESLKKGYDTFVGERGIRLSGGQRQRIGIARALYKEASVIIFDEATSALDTETEKAVMEAIEGLGGDLTILIIAHRLSTVKNCDLIVELNNGEITRTGKYEDLFQNE